VYRNENALPRAFLVARQRTVPDADAALAGTIAPDFNARRLALTERPVPGVPQEDGADARSPGTARLVDYKNERAVVAAKARTRSLLVLTDIHFPGWKATVNGRPARIERVDYLLRGVVVPPGAHRVEFRYEPVSWRVGWIISSAALTAVAALALVGWRRRAGPRGAGR
jgi:Bacterial membrane protein YfhO